MWLYASLTGIICLIPVYPVEDIQHSYQNNILNNICFIPSLYLHLPTTCAWGFSVKWHWHSLVEVIFSSHDLCWRNVNTRGLRTIYQGLDSEIEYSNTTHQCFIIFQRRVENKDMIIWIYVEASLNEVKYMQLAFNGETFCAEVSEW